MEPELVKQRLLQALKELATNDRHLLENDLSERCIASRLAIYLQAQFTEYSVDVEYNRHGSVPKKLGLPDECVNYQDKNGAALVVPDIIVHKRGPDGPNLLVLELKKTTNPDPYACDRQRVCAFRKQLGYYYGALIQCETQTTNRPGIEMSEWFE